MIKGRPVELFVYIFKIIIWLFFNLSPKLLTETLFYTLTTIFSVSLIVNTECADKSLARPTSLCILFNVEHN